MNKENFYKETLANWKEVAKVNFKPDYKSNSGSEYMYTKEGVYRYSDHWDYKIASCIWVLNGKVSLHQAKIGFCKWDDFKSFDCPKKAALEIHKKAINKKLYSKTEIWIYFNARDYDELKNNLTNI